MLLEHWQALGSHLTSKCLPDAEEHWNSKTIKEPLLQTQLLNTCIRIERNKAKLIPPTKYFTSSRFYLAETMTFCKS